jgi:hypothetical protein
MPIIGLAAGLEACFGDSASVSCSYFSSTFYLDSIGFFSTTFYFWIGFFTNDCFTTGFSAVAYFTLLEFSTFGFSAFFTGYFSLIDGLAISS